MQGLLDAVWDILLSPTLWMCVLFGIVYAVLFTLWRGGGFAQLLRDIVAAVVCFGLGQLFATFVRVPSPRVGDVHLLWGSVFSVLGLLAARRYWLPRHGEKPGAASPGAPTKGASPR